MNENMENVAMNDATEVVDAVSTGTTLGEKVIGGIVIGGVIAGAVALGRKAYTWVKNKIDAKKAAKADIIDEECEDMADEQ